MRNALTVPTLLAALALPAALLSSPTKAADPAPTISFRKVVIDREFRSEGIAVADVNRDGQGDLMAGNLWYEAPVWRPHEIAPVETFDRARGYSNTFLNFAHDVNRDGWPDQVRIDFPGKPATWRENPGKATGHWREHPVWRSACNESPAFSDRLVPGRRVLLFGFDDRTMAWFEPNTDATAEFRHHPISAPGAPGTGRFAHGLGVGDVNGDGRADVLCTEGYWQAPKDRRGGPWPFVAGRLGDACAQMYAHDVSGDGLPDVLSSSAHNIGVWWHEQRRGASGPEFVRHTIDDTFSQSHALAMADLNRDGRPDLVTGKRFWAHGPEGDVQPNEPCVLYWYEYRRAGGAVRWTRHLIDTDSGVGCQIAVADVNRDRRLDIAVANKKGVFLFEQAAKP